MISDKKALVHTFVVSLIIFLAAFIIIALWMVKVGIIFETDADMNLCRATLTMQRKTEVELVIVDFDSPIKSSCKRRLVNIKADTITVRPQSKLSVVQKVGLYLESEKDPTKLVRTTNYDDVNEKVLNSYVAESMRRCWQMVVEGRVEVFNPETLPYQTNICLLCDEITVTRGRGVSTTLNNLPTYLSETYTPVLNKGDISQSYATFLDLEGAQSEDEFPRAKKCYDYLQFDPTPTITDGTYATVAVRRFKDFDVLGRTSKVQGCMTVGLVPVSRIRSLCDFVAN